MDVVFDCGLVAGQGVVVVEAVDVDVAQVKLGVRKHGRRIHVGRKFLGWNKERTKNVSTSLFGTVREGFVYYKEIFWVPCFISNAKLGILSIIPIFV